MRSGSFATGSTVLALALWTGASGASETDIYLPLHGFVQASPATSVAGRGPSLNDEPSRRANEATGSPLALPTAHFRLIEMPSTVQPGTSYKRPHHAIGYRWLGAESWLREHGFDAQTCYLPMVRLHTRISPSANVSGTLWIYGRCAFR